MFAMSGPNIVCTNKATPWCISADHSVYKWDAFSLNKWAHPFLEEELVPRVDNKLYAISREGRGCAPG
jgi:hypothetical protein